MRKISLFVICMVCTVADILAQPYNVTIRGKIEGLSKGTLYLTVQSMENRVDTVGKSTFDSAEFTLKGKINEPVVARVMVDGYSGGFTFFAEPNNHYSAFLCNNPNAFIKGGTLQNAWLSFQEKLLNLKLRKDSLQKLYDTYKADNKFRSASRVNDSITSIQHDYTSLRQAFLTSHDDVLGAYLMQQNALLKDADAVTTAQMYNSLGAKAKLSLSGRIMKERLERIQKMANGRVAPDFTVKDIQGRQVTLSKIKARIKILDFWASWCGPCRLNNPSLKKIYAEFHDKGLEIIGITLDTNRQRWMEAVKQDQLPWLQVSMLDDGDKNLMQRYNITGIPAMFVLDEHNRILISGLRGEKLHLFLQNKLMK